MQSNSQLHPWMFRITSGFGPSGEFVSLRYRKGDLAFPSAASSCLLTSGRVKSLIVSLPAVEVRSFFVDMIVGIESSKRQGLIDVAQMIDLHHFNNVLVHM